MRPWRPLVLIAWVFLAGSLGAEAEAPEDPAHQKLRDLKKELEDAFNKRDVDHLVESLHADVIVVWQNGEVSRKREGVRDYYKRMLLDKNSIVESVTVQPEVAELSILYGPEMNKDTALAFGTLGDHYKLRDGMEFNLNSHWTCTLVKEGDRWLIAEAHMSTNTFDNEVLSLAVKRIAYWVGGIALIAGLILGVPLAFLIRRRRV